MAKSGPDQPPRPAQQGVVEPAGAKNTFDGEESTEVMDIPVVPAKAAAAPASPPAVEEPQDLDEKDKKYVAPRVIPAAAVPDKADGAKIVLNIPDARADRAPPAPPLKRGAEAVVDGDKPAVAEVRARRRAPTVKMARPNLTALKPADDAIDVALDDDFEPPPPLASADGGDAAPLTASKGLGQAASIGQAVPIGLTPRAPEVRAVTSLPVPVSQRPSGPAHEAPATAIAIQETRSEKSRLPWVLFGALTLGAAAAGVFVATRKPDQSVSTKAPAAQASNATATQVATAAVETAPAETAPAPTVAATTAEPTASTDLASASATTPQPTQVAVTPLPRPVATYPTARPTTTVPAYTAPRPTATFPRPPPKKTSDIPSGI